MDGLDKQLTRSSSDKERKRIVRKWAGGVCIRCYNIPSIKVSYQIDGGILVERYCDDCFKYFKDGRSKQILDKLLS